MEEFHNIIQQIGNELGIKVTFIANKWLIVLEKDGNIHYIEGHKFDLNNHGIGNSLDDKGIFNDLLVYKNIPTVYQKIIFKNYNKKEVIDFFDKNNKEIIVKGNVGTCGNEVFKVNNENNLFSIIDYLLNSQYSISLSPFYDIKNEYRVIILNKKVRIVYGKTNPIIIGNGKDNIKSLAIKFNDYYLNKTILNEDYIPKKEEEIVLDYHFNLSRGAKSFMNIDNDLKNKIENLALKVTNSLNITRFASISSQDFLYCFFKALLASVTALAF